jgi:hypothetical protein
MLFFCLGGLEGSLERKIYFPKKIGIDIQMSVKHKGRIFVSTMYHINWMKSS